jgi:L-fucose isomerase
MQDNHKRIGLITTMSRDTTWAQSVVDGVTRQHGVVKANLEKMGFAVLDEGPLIREYGDMLAAGRSLRARGIHALVLFVGTWTYANCAAAAALEADVPVVIWGDATPGTVGLVGAAITRGGMAELGIYANLIYGEPDDPQALERARVLLQAACAATGLRGQRLGYAGGRSMGMLTAVADPNEVRRKFGVEIDSFEQMEVIERSDGVDEARVRSFYQWMQGRFGPIVAKEDVVLKQIRLYLSLQNIIQERAYDFVAVKCLPELPSLFTTFCLAHAIMGDAQDDQGPKPRTVFACEADLNAAFTMQILHLLQDGPVLFADFLEWEKGGIINLVNCGSQPTDFAVDPKDVRWEIESTHEFQWKYGGTSPQHVTRPGRFTLARLYRESGEYGMMIAPAETIYRDRETFRDFMWERPRSFVRLLCDRNALLDAMRSNHVHAAFGDWVAELEEVCRILGIRAVVVH